MYLLDILIPDGLAILIFAALVLIAYRLDVWYSRKRDRQNDKIKELTGAITMMTKEQAAQVEIGSNNMAAAKLKEWKETELQIQINLLAEHARKSAINMYEEWKRNETKAQRADAVKRSLAVNLGKITEHLIPFSDQFKSRDFNPQDCRFIGNPVDLILFDGASPNSEKDLVTIVFIEVKTGKAPLKDNQKRVKEAVINKRVEWLELTKGEFSWQVEV